MGLAMIISRGRRFIFVHIPKTGGTALSLALEARAMGRALAGRDARTSDSRSANTSAMSWVLHRVAGVA